MFISSVNEYPKCSAVKSGQLLCAMQQMERGTEPLQACAQGLLQAVHCLSQRNIGELPSARRRLSLSLRAISVQGCNRQANKTSQAKVLTEGGDLR